MSRSLLSSPPNARHRLLRTKPIVAIVAFFALFLTGLPVAAAHAAAPTAGTYSGDSTAYTGATVSFAVDSNGMMSDFETESYCFDGFSVLPVQWVGMPATSIEVGTPFAVNWEYGTDSVRPYYELTGTVNADGTVSGTGRAGFLPSGTCGGMNFTWTAELENVEPVPDPTAAVSPSSLTESELADSGVTITGADFPASTSVSLTVGGVAAGTQNADANGDVSFAYTSSTLGTGSHQAVLTAGSASASTSFTVNADPIVYDPTASVTPSTLTESELADSGVTVTGGGFPAGASVGLAIAGIPVQAATANAVGDVSFSAYTSTTLGTGTHPVLLTAGDLSANASFAVNADPIVYDPTASVTPSTLTESELADSGVQVSGAGFAPGSQVTFSVNGDTVTSSPATAAGAVTFAYTSSAIGAGAHDVELSAAEGSATTGFTVVADPVYTPVVAVSPTTLTVSELAETGVSIAGQGFPANTDVTLSVAGADIDTTLSNDSGDVDFSYTSDSLGAGAHEVRLTADAPGATVEGSFEVTDDPIVYDPTATAAPVELTESELADTGTVIAGSGFPAEVPVTLAIGGADVETLSSDADGNVSFAYTSTTLGIGAHTATLTAEALSASVDFTVTENPVVPAPVQIPATDPSASDLDPDLENGIIAPAEAQLDETIAVTLPGVAPGTYVGVWLFGAPTYLGTHEVDDDGQVFVTLSGVEAGEAQLAVWSDPDTFIGWAALSLLDDAGNGGTDPGNGGTDPGNGGTDPGNGGTDPGNGGTDPGNGGTDPGNGGTGSNDGGKTGSSATKGGELARTGSANAGLLAGAGALLLVAGAGLVLNRRRRTAE